MKGKIVEVEFYDHCIQPKGPKDNHLMVFKVWGRVQKMDSNVLIIRTWELKNGSRATKTHNNEVAKILVPSIIKITELFF